MSREEVAEMIVHSLILWGNIQDSPLTKEQMINMLNEGIKRRG